MIDFGLDLYIMSLQSSLLENYLADYQFHISDNDDSIKHKFFKFSWPLLIDVFLLKKIKSLKDLNIKYTRWIDVGCGHGLAFIYVALKYRLKSQLLFDFDEKCITYSKKNILLLINLLVR